MKMADMKIPKPVSKSLIDVPMNPKTFWAKISIIKEISDNFDFPQIIEYQIYSPIFLILQTVFG